MESESYKYLIRNFLDEDGRVTAYPAKRKMKIYALYYLSEFINNELVYTESEFNDLLDAHHTFHDPATLRRELFLYGFITREADGSVYRKSDKTPQIEV